MSRQREEAGHSPNEGNVLFGMRQNRENGRFEERSARGVDLPHNFR